MNHFHVMRALLVVAPLALVGCPDNHLEVSHLAPLEDAVLAVDETHARARILQLEEGREVRVDLGIQQSPRTTLNGYLEKLLFLVTRDITRKWTMPPHNWACILNQLAIRFEGRFPLS